MILHYFMYRICLVHIYHIKLPQARTHCIFFIYVYTNMYNAHASIHHILIHIVGTNIMFYMQSCMRWTKEATINRYCSNSAMLPSLSSVHGKHNNIEKLIIFYSSKHIPHGHLLYMSMGISIGLWILCATKSPFC